GGRCRGVATVPIACIRLPDGTASISILLRSAKISPSLTRDLSIRATCNRSSPMDMRKAVRAILGKKYRPATPTETAQDLLNSNFIRCNNQGGSDDWFYAYF